MKVVEFILFGQPFTAMSAGPLDPFNHAVSFVVNCDDQAEVDRYWNALLKGGAPEQWLAEGPLRSLVADRADRPRRDDGLDRSSQGQAGRGRDGEDGQDRHRRAEGGVCGNDVSAADRFYIAGILAGSSSTKRGSILAPCHRTPKNRCGPVERPVVPTRPRRSPFLTSCPACTLISDR